MKNQTLLIVILLLSSCAIVNSDDDPKSTMDTEFQMLLEAFNDIELPFTILDDKSDERERVTYENSIKYLGSKWIDEESGIPDSEIRAIGKFIIDDSIYCLVYRNLDLPVGSGNHITYNIASFKSNGTLIDKTKIAEFTSWNDGYTEQTCTIQKDYKIIAQHEFEDELENKRGKYDIQIINKKGVFDTNGLEKRTDSAKISSSKTNTINYKELKKYVYPPMIKKDLSGQFAKGYTWKDQLGENYLIATTKSSKSPGTDEDATDHYLYVKHYVDAGEKYPKILWKTTDFVKGCSFDNMLSIIDEAFSITDLDNDNIAETIYMYTSGCISDVSPYPLKLIMHEGEDKMAIRGMIRMDMEGYETESEYKIDEKSFEGQPEIFKAFAEEHWLRNEVVGF